MVRRSIVPVFAALGVLAGLAGCSNETAGNATTDGPTAPTQPSQPSKPNLPSDGPGSSASDSSDPLANLNPCDLLTEQQAATLELANRREDVYGAARVCIYRHQGATLKDSYTVQVEIYQSQAIEDVVGSNVTPVPTIGSHNAVRFTPHAGGCSIAMATSASSRVDTSAVGGEQAQACALVGQVAAAVEPGLP